MQKLPKLPVSLVIITFNEENNIKRCIESVPWASEVIVLDSQSSDETKMIAERCGAKVFEQKFLGYREQKQKAVELATQPWILSLDADEVLSPELIYEIPEMMIVPGKNLHLGYRMPRLSFHLGRWIKHGGWYPDYQTRLFKKAHAKWTGGEVHEYVQVSGDVGKLKNPIQHYVFQNLEHQIATNNKYSSQGALQLKNSGEKFRLSKLIFKPIGKFFECYVWKLGFLDGDAGFIIALGAAQSLFLKYAKLWESETI